MLTSVWIVSLIQVVSFVSPALKIRTIKAIEWWSKEILQVVAIVETLLLGKRKVFAVFTQETKKQSISKSIQFLKALLSNCSYAFLNTVLSIAMILRLETLMTKILETELFSRKSAINSDLYAKKAAVLRFSIRSSTKFFKRGSICFLPLNIVTLVKLFATLSANRLPIRRFFQNHRRTIL